ncbi:MAG TPA: hypothetical protein VHN78_08520 [Chloroflexota bacterium]|nr:hypothetical protein [Chloroflexota bacterium]
MIVNRCSAGRHAARDLRQWADFLHAPSLPPQNEGHHHALWDARWNRQAWYYLDALARKRA